MSRTKRKRASRRWRVGLWIVLMGLCGWGYLSAAKADGKDPKLDKASKAIKAIKPSSASPAIQKQIEVQFAKMEKAMSAKNIQSLLQFLTPDFTQKNLDGKTADRKAARANFEAAMRAMKSLSAGFTIEKATSEKAGTLVTGKYLFAGMTNPKGQGEKPQQLALAFPMKTLWVKTSAGWRLKRMEQLKGGVVTMDGRVPE